MLCIILYTIINNNFCSKNEIWENKKVKDRHENPRETMQSAYNAKASFKEEEEEEREIGLRHKAQGSQRDRSAFFNPYMPFLFSGILLIQFLSILFHSWSKEGTCTCSNFLYTAGQSHSVALTHIGPSNKSPTSFLFTNERRMSSEEVRVKKKELFAFITVSLSRRKGVL